MSKIQKHIKSTHIESIKPSNLERSNLQLRWAVFKQNKRAFYSLLIFLVLLVCSIFAEFIANEKPLFIYKDSKMYFPVFVDYPESAFGGDFQTPCDYLDSYVRDELLKDAFVLRAIIPYSYDSIIMDLDAQAPTPPDSKHWLGTDDKARDVASRLLYGYRISIIFALILSVCSVVIGVVVGALQGYYGGALDLVGQRMIEIFNAVPILFVIIIISSVFEPSFWWILLANLVRAEFLKARNLEYVKAAHAMGVSDIKIIFSYILPNAMSATLTFTPFIMAGSIVTLSSLDFLGFGMPVGSASLLSILVFIGEGLRDALDPHIKAHLKAHIKEARRESSLDSKDSKQGV